MSSVAWLCVIGVLLSLAAVITSYVAIGAMGLVVFPFFAWFDWRRFGTPPSGSAPGWWWRFGPGGGGGGAKVPARTPVGPRQPAGSQALPLPDD
jgi:hypothetical protein